VINGPNMLFDAQDAPLTLPAGVIYRPCAFDGAAQATLLQALEFIIKDAPPVQARTKGGGTTSAAMTNSGRAGWWSDARGYRYQTHRPDSAEPWPAMPAAFLEAVRDAMAPTPWPDFAPDACLINYYGPSAKMGLHQDRNEKDLTQPILTLCLGDDADFMIGGFSRSDKSMPIVVRSGDALILGGDARMRFHGIRKIYPNTSPLSAVAGRYSLTFRKAL